MNTDALKRFLRGAGRALAAGMLAADPIAYSYCLMCKAEADGQVAFIPGPEPTTVMPFVHSVSMQAGIPVENVLESNLAQRGGAQGERP
jgi:hypothetical protein